MDQNIQSNYDKKKKKSFRNSIISTAALSLITVAIFSAQTYAYFTDRNINDQNSIVAGNLDIELIQMDDIEQGEITQVDPVSIMPATAVEKIVMVKNTGSLSVYVRVKIEKSIIKSENQIPDGWEHLISCNFNLDDPETANVIEGAWIYYDGYYYYSTALQAGSTTSPLFDTILFSPNMGNEFAKSSIAFTVISQATQASGNSSDPLSAWGWPADNKNDKEDESQEESTVDETESVEIQIDETESTN